MKNNQNKNLKDISEVSSVTELIERCDGMRKDGTCGNGCNVENHNKPCVGKKCPYRFGEYYHKTGGGCVQPGSVLPKHVDSTKAAVETAIAIVGGSTYQQRVSDQYAAVETANRAAVQMGGWGLPDEKGAQLPTVNRRQRQEWISKCVRKWCLRSKLAILEGTTMLLGNGGYRFLQKVWDGGTPMLPDEAVDAMEVFLRAKGVKK